MIEVCLMLHGCTIYYGSLSKGRGVAAALIEVGIPLLQCTPLVLISWAIRVYARRQGTTFWFILYRTMYVPPFNYNILTNIPIPVDIIPSPPQSRRRAHPQRYTQQLPPIIYHLLISAHTRHPDPKQAPGTWSDWFSRVFFYY